MSKNDILYRYVPVHTDDGDSTLTIASMKEADGSILRVAFALQNPLDEFTKQKARLIAGGRLRKQTTEYQYSRNFTMPFVHHMNFMEKFFEAAQAANINPKQKQALAAFEAKMIEAI